MTVQTEIDKSGPYAGAGTTGPFTVGFRFLADSHLRVVRTSADGVETTLVLTTDYTVTGAGAASGTLTLVVALPAGETLTIVRDVPFLQLADYVNNDAFPAESHEGALDLLTMQTQQLNEGLSRALTLPVSVAGASTVLPAPEANHVIGWNADETGLENYDPAAFATIVAFGTANADVFDGDGVTTAFVLSNSPGAMNNLDVSIGGVTQTPGIDYTWSFGTTITFTTPPPVGTDNVLVRYMQGLAAPDQPLRAELAAATGSSLVGFQQSGTGAVLRTAQDKMRETLSVIDFGAVADGVYSDTSFVSGTDNTGAFQLAVNAAATLRSKKVVVPSGRYFIGGSVTMPYGVSLTGDSDITVIRPSNMYAADTTPVQSRLDTGTVILVTSTVVSPFIYRSANSFVGLTFYYPNQLPTSAAPTTYPPTFKYNTSIPGAEIMASLLFEKIQFVNSFYWIDMRVGNLNPQFKDLFGCAISKGIVIDGNGGTPAIRDCAFGRYSWVGGMVTAINAYIQANAVAITCLRADGIKASNIQVFDMNAGFLFGVGIVNAATGAYGTISEYHTEGTNYPIYTSGTQDIGITVDQMSCAARLAVLYAANDQGASNFSFSNCKSWGGVNQYVVQSISAVNPLKFRAGNCRFSTYTTAGIIYSAAAGATLSVADCVFDDTLMPPVVTTAQLYHLKFTDNVMPAANQFQTAAPLADYAEVDGNMGAGGSDVTTIASAATIQVRNATDIIQVTGTTNVTTISGGWVNRRITCYCPSGVTFATGGNIWGGKVIPAQEGITFVYDGATWRPTR